MHLVAFAGVCRDARNRKRTEGMMRSIAANMCEDDAQR